MRSLRILVTLLLIFAVAWPVRAQSLAIAHPAATAAPAPRLNLAVSSEQLIPRHPMPLPANAAMHPAAKGAIIGGAAGMGFWGAIAVWYCTIGPHEVGECENAGQWARGMAVYGAAGAAIGAVIGAIAGRR